MENVRFCLIQDSDHGIEFSLYNDSQRKLVFDEKEKPLSLCFSVYFEGFGGAGEADSMTCYDLKQLVNCVNSVLNDEKRVAIYCCENEGIGFIFRTEENEKYSLEAFLTAPCTPEDVAVKKDNLTREEFVNLVEPFFIWENAYLSNSYFRN